jgi:flagellar hook-associated protein 3 FlgL
MTPVPSASLTATPQGSLGRIVAESATTRARLDQLTMQVSSGRVSDSFAGLGYLARISLDLRPVMASMQAWQGNIAAANSRTDIALSAMDRITAIASDFYARTDTLTGLDPANVDATAAAARDALRELAGLLNTADGDVHVFAGQDSANLPVPNADAILSSGFYTQIAAAVAGLSGSGATATIAATLAVGASNIAGTSPFSTALSQPAASLQGLRSQVEVADQRQEPFGIIASGNAVAVSAGTSTTGSYMRDLMRALATIGSLSSAQVADPGFAPLVADIRTSLPDAISAMAADTGIAGNQHAMLAKTQEQNSSYLISITAQVSGIEDVDMAAALSSVSQMQTRLQASYQMISTLRDLTLTRYL